MICSDFCPFLNKFGHCDATMRPPERIIVCPHSKIRHSIGAGNIGGSSGGMPHGKKTD